MVDFRDMPDVSGLEEALKTLTGEEISLDEVWQYARECEEWPSFENIFMDLLFYRLKDAIIKKYGEFGLDEKDVDYYINCIDSHFSVFGEEVDDLNAIKEIIVENLPLTDFFRSQYEILSTPKLVSKGSYTTLSYQLWCERKCSKAIKDDVASFGMVIHNIEFVKDDDPGFTCLLTVRGKNND